MFSFVFCQAVCHLKAVGWFGISDESVAWFGWLGGVVGSAVRAVRRFWFRRSAVPAVLSIFSVSAVWDGFLAVRRFDRFSGSVGAIVSVGQANRRFHRSGGLMG